VTQEQPPSEFWLESARAKSRFLSPKEREELRKRARAEAKRLKGLENDFEAGQALRLLLHLGGADSRELDLIGLSALKSSPCSGDAPLLARLVIRHLEDAEERLQLNVEQVDGLRRFFGNPENVTEFARGMLSEQALEWALGNNLDI